jgi:hypothetical protein
MTEDQQDRQRTDVSLRLVHEINVAMERRQVLRISVCVCVRAWVSAYVHMCVVLGALTPASACERVAVLIQHATHAAILSSAASLAPTHSSTLFYKRFPEKKITECKRCVLVFSTTII